MEAAQIKSELQTALKVNDKQTALRILDPIIKAFSEEIMHGTLKKNLIKRLQSKGFNYAAAENLIEVATVRAENVTGIKNYK